MKQSFKRETRSEVFDADDTYFILECRGCGYLYFKRLHTNSEEMDVEISPYGEHHSFPAEHVRFWPPTTSSRKPDWIDDLSAVDWNLYSLYQDIYTARANDLGVLAAIAIRTCFDRASELKGIPTTASFSEKLDQLAKEQWISHRDRNALKIMVNAGSAAAHSGWRPKETELHAMQVILDGFLYRAFLQGDVAKTLESTVPDKAPTPAAERTNFNTAPK